MDGIAASFLPAPAASSRRVRVAVALGSNLGNREGHLRDAVDALTQYIADLRVSSFRETEPVGVSGGQPRYVNAAAVGETSSTAPELLRALLEVETRLGRERPFPGAPRTIDIDLIFYGDAVSDTADLVVPHPRFRERRFVLEPLAELVPDWIDPVTRKSVAELLRLVVA